MWRSIGSIAHLDLSGTLSIRTIAASPPGSKPLPCFRCRSSPTAPWIENVPSRLFAASIPCLPALAKLHRRSREETCPLRGDFRARLGHERALEDSFELTSSRRIHDPANRCAESAKPDNSSGSPCSAEPSPMAFRSSPASSRPAPVQCLRARSAMTKPDHAPPATKDRLDVPTAITGCLSVRFNRSRSTRT